VDIWSAPEAPMAINFSPGTLACFIVLSIGVIIYLVQSKED
jgi:hypothetical protein